MGLVGQNIRHLYASESGAQPESLDGILSVLRLGAREKYESHNGSIVENNIHCELGDIHEF